MTIGAATEGHWQSKLMDAAGPGFGQQLLLFLKIMREKAASGLVPIAGLGLTTRENRNAIEFRLTLPISPIPYERNLARLAFLAARYPGANLKDASFRD